MTKPKLEHDINMAENLILFVNPSSRVLAAGSGLVLGRLGGQEARPHLAYFVLDSTQRLGDPRQNSRPRLAIEGL